MGGTDTAGLHYVTFLLPPDPGPGTPYVRFYYAFSITYVPLRYWSAIALVAVGADKTSIKCTGNR